MRRVVFEQVPVSSFLHSIPFCHIAHVLMFDEQRLRHCLHIMLQILSGRETTSTDIDEISSSIRNLFQHVLHHGKVARIYYPSV